MDQDPSDLFELPLSPSPPSPQLLPLFILDGFRSIPGLSGLFIAEIFSGTLSTLSSGLNSLSAITLEDYIRPCCSNYSDGFAALISTALSFLFGGVIIGLAYGVHFLPGGILEVKPGRFLRLACNCLTLEAKVIRGD